MKNINELYNKNVAKIDELSEKIKLINANSHHSLSLVFNLSTVFYSISLCVLFFVCNALGPLSTILKPLFIGGPILLGTTTVYLLKKIFKVKQRFKKFSKSKNFKQKLEESIKYQIEREKLISLNKVLGNILNNIHNDSTINNINDYIEKTNLVLNNYEQKLETLSAEKVLSKQFYYYTNNYNKNTFSAWRSLIPLALFTAYNLPCILNITNSPSLLGLLNSAIFFFVVGEATTITYFLKKKNDYKKVFEKMNNELGEQHVLEYVNCNQNFEQELENAIEETNKLLVNECNKQDVDTKKAINECKKYIDATNEPVYKEDIEKEEDKKTYVKKLKGMN